MSKPDLTALKLPTFSMKGSLYPSLETSEIGLSESVYKMTPSLEIQKLRQ